MEKCGHKEDLLAPPVYQYHIGEEDLLRPPLSQDQDQGHGKEELLRLLPSLDLTPFHLRDRPSGQFLAQLDLGICFRISWQPSPGRFRYQQRPEHHLQ